MGATSLVLHPTTRYYPRSRNGTFDSTPWRACSNRSGAAGINDAVICSSIDLDVRSRPRE